MFGTANFAWKLKTPAGAAHRFRSMRRSDLPRVLDIERGGYEFPWSERAFSECLRARYVCVIAESGSAVAGYGIMTVAAGECHILNLCVHPDYRRRGIGTALLQYLTAIARGRNSHMAFLEVRVSNRGAQTLYNQVGFNEIATRHRYYPAKQGREDALVLAKAL